MKRSIRRATLVSAFLTLLFLATALTAFGQENPLEPEKAYLIGPGDEIAVKVMGEPQFDFNAAIDDEGKIQVPFFEERLSAKCRTERQLRDDVTKMISKYLKNPMVSLRVTERKSRPPASVFGEVRQPQQVGLARKVRLLELLSFTGGVTEDAGGMVQVFRTQAPMCDADNQPVAGTQNGQGAPVQGMDVPYRLYSLSSIKQGKDEANPVIYPGDVVIVQKSSPVYITGEVRAPQGIRLSENGITLTQALAMVGGFTREAKSKDVKVYRLKPDKTDRDVIAVNIDLIKKGDQKDVILEPYDIVEVDKTKKSIAQTILEIAIGAGKGGITSMTNGLGYRVMY